MGALDRGIIGDVLAQQHNDVDKAIDELLTLAVGDDLFARSVFIEEKLSASQHLKKFGAQQDEILRQCQERHAEEQRKLQERIEAENRQKIEAEKKRKEEEEKAKQFAEEKKNLAQMMAQQELVAQQELSAAEKIKREAEQARLEVEREKAEIAEEKKRIAQEKEEMELQKRKAEEESRAAPKLSIYTRKQHQETGRDQDSIASEIKSLFIENGFKDSEISMHDVSQDMELASFLKEICKNADIKYPLVCAGNIPIGTIDNVKTIVADQTKLDQLKAGEFVPDFLTEDQANSLKDGTGFVG